MSNRIIASKESEDCPRWQVPDVGSAASPGKAAVGVSQTQKEIERRRQQGYDAGFAQGKQEGIKAGQAQFNQQALQVSQIASQLSKPLEELDDEIVNELVTLSMTIAKHMVRREISTNPGEIVAVVREAAATLPAASRTIRIFLNPEDATLLKEALSITEQSAWELVDDPSLTRGGCRLETENAQLDASLEHRLAAVVAQIMGGERAGD